MLNSLEDTTYWLFCRHTQSKERPHQLLKKDKEHSMQPVNPVWEDYPTIIAKINKSIKLQWWNFSVSLSKETFFPYEQKKIK